MPDQSGSLTPNINQTTRTIMHKIKRVSFIFRIIFQILFIAMPISLAIGWFNAPDALVLVGGFINFDAIPHAYATKILHTLSTSEKLTGFLVSAVPMMVYLFIVYSLIKLFRLYEQGVIFSIEIVQHIRNIGYALLADQIISPFYQFAMGIVLTIHNPPGHGFIGITLDQNNLGILLTALLVILISWIMTEGCKLNEEQQLTV